MIDFRYHVVSIIAVFLALALGLFLGSTTLQGTVTNNLSNQAHHVTSQNHQLERQRDALLSSLDDEHGFSSGLEPYVVANQLLGESVTMIAAPGVDDSGRQQLHATLTQSGATVTADVELAPAYLDGSKDAELGQLAAELARPQQRLTAPTGATRLAAVLAAAMVAKPGGRHLSATRLASIVRTLTAANLITVTGGIPTSQANLAVLLVPAPSSQSADTVQSADDLAVALAGDLRTGSAGTVVTGPAASSGPLFAVQQDDTLTSRISTVGAGPADPAAGRIATILALAAARNGSVGSFGLGQRTPVPTPAPTTSPSP